MHILASFEHHWLEAEHQQLEGREHPGRPCPDNYHRFRIVHILIIRQGVRLILSRGVGLVAVTPYRLLARIDGALYGNPLKATGLRFYFLKARLPGQGAADFEFFHITPLPVISPSSAYQTANCPGDIPR